MKEVKLMCAGLYVQQFGQQIDQMFERVERLVPLRARTPFGDSYTIIKDELSVEGDTMCLFRPGKSTGKYAGYRGEANIVKEITEHTEPDLHSFLEYFKELCGLTREFLDRANNELDRLEARKSQRS